LKAGVPQAFLGFIPYPLGLLRSWLIHFFIINHYHGPFN
jgi:hypothetical protein